MVIEDIFDEEFTPLQLAQTADNAGGATETYAELTAKKFWGKLDSLSSNSYVQNLAKSYSAQHLILAPFDVDVAREQILRSSTGKEYEVLEVEHLYNHHSEIKVGE